MPIDPIKFKALLERRPTVGDMHVTFLRQPMTDDDDSLGTTARTVELRIGRPEVVEYTSGAGGTGVEDLKAIVKRYVDEDTRKMLDSPLLMAQGGQLAEETTTLYATEDGHLRSCPLLEMEVGHFHGFRFVESPMLKIDSAALLVAKLAASTIGTNVVLDTNVVLGTRAPKNEPWYNRHRKNAKAKGHRK